MESHDHVEPKIILGPHLEVDTLPLLRDNNFDQPKYIAPSCVEIEHIGTIWAGACPS